MPNEQIRMRNDMPLARQILRLTSTTRKQDLNICDCPFEISCDLLPNNFSRTHKPDEFQPSRRIKLLLINRSQKQGSQIK